MNDKPTMVEIRVRHKGFKEENIWWTLSKSSKCTHTDRGILLDRLDEAQFKIDMLMLEYCPEDMTDSQRKEWAENQTNDLPTKGTDMKTIEHIIKELRCLETDLREVTIKADMDFQADRLKHIANDLLEIWVDFNTPKEDPTPSTQTTKIHGGGTGNN